MSVITRTSDWFFGLMGYVRRRDSDVQEWQNRSGIYAVNEALYAGSVYATRANGGALEDVLLAYIGEGYTNPNRYPIYPYFMPFSEIVETYQNVFPGSWGEELKPVGVTKDKPINPKIVEPLGRIWRTSNLDTEKQKLVRWAANYGTVGIRITSEVAEGTAPARAVLSIDHPSRLFNFEEDGRGNVTAAVLKYQTKVNTGTLVDPDWQMVEVIEQITKDDFSRTVDGTEEIDDANRRNRLGFCPYVIHRHKDNGTPYGDWAYKGSEVIVHRINWRTTRQDKSIDRHQFPKWFGGGSGKPTTVPMDEDSMTFVDMKPDVPPPFLKAIVGDIDQKSAMEFTMMCRDELRGRQPELNLNDVKLLGNTSGEALAQVLKPTEQAIRNVRPGYDHSMIRALQMALSAGVSVGAWDLGTGTDPDSAFRSGDEDFALADRPALPETPQQQLVKASAGVADRKAKFELAAAASRAGVNDPKEILMIAGYDEAEATRLAAVKTAVPTGNGSNGDRMNRLLGNLQ